MINKVIKSNGSIVEFDPDKLNKWVEWASEYGASWSEIALKAYRKCGDYCSTKDLHKALIEVCVEKADYKHFKLAGRLLIGSLYKTVFGGHENIPTLADFYQSMVARDLWTKMNYSSDELSYLNEVMDHSRDLRMTYTEAKQLRDKYMITDRTTGECYETPQFLYMGMAMANMENMPKERRLYDVVKLYQYLSQKKINAPTPFLTNLRTRHRGYASCCVYSAGDSIDSLATGDHIAYKMTAASAGIGSHLQTRSKHDPIRGGTVEHMGKVGYFRAIESMVSANKQNNRGGAATVYYTVLDPEIETLLMLKSVVTPHQKQVRGIDYSIGAMNRFAKAISKGDQWMLISYLYAPDLYEAMYSGDQTEFEKLYDKYLNDFSVPKTLVSARKIAVTMLQQGLETGRIYLHFMDEMNNHTPFKEKIYMSNLCSEIAIISKSYEHVVDLYREEETSGEIGLCSLGAIVQGNTTDEEYEDVAYYTALMIDNVISLMDYPFPNLKYTATRRRSIGVGMTNLAYDMANNGMSYTTEAGKNFIHRSAERHSYYLHKASLRMAKEFGTCEWIDRTKYPEGWLPIDTYNKNVDSVHSQELLYDWEQLRREIVETGGIRHSVLEAYMPNESSSLATDSTNSIYPIRGLKIIKAGGSTRNIFLAPESDRLAAAYDIAWRVPHKDMTDTYAIVQKFTGQAISADEYIDYEDFPDKKIGDKELLKRYLYIKKMGLKSRYYVNTRTGAPKDDLEEIEDKGCAGGGCTL